MKRLLLFGTAVAGLLIGGYSQASAETPDGWYAGADAGYHLPNSIETGSLSEINARVKGDWMVDGRLGYRFTPNWRAEVEGAYRPGHIDNISASGHYRMVSAMGNLLFDIFPQYPIHPFIGGGVGASFPMVDENFHSLTYITSNRARFAWQGIGGLTVVAGQRLNIDLTYRYLDAGAQTIRCRAGCPDNAIRFGHYKDSSLTLGVRYAFGAVAAPPPPPPPPPAPAPVVEAPPPPPPPPPMAEAPPPPPPAFIAKSFVVYFPFDQSVLTPEAQVVVQEAARYANDGHATRLNVVGHTDASGSLAYNERLSERRAKATADALVGLGVPAGELKVDWKGKTDLAVQTADGVKEPLNRRSTIDVNF